MNPSVMPAPAALFVVTGVVNPVKSFAVLTTVADAVVPQSIWCIPVITDVALALYELTTTARPLVFEVSDVNAVSAAGLIVAPSLVTVPPALVSAKPDPVVESVRSIVPPVDENFPTASAKNGDVPMLVKAPTPLIAPNVEKSTPNPSVERTRPVNPVKVSPVMESVITVEPANSLHWKKCLRPG